MINIFKRIINFIYNNIYNTHRNYYGKRNYERIRNYGIRILQLQYNIIIQYL